MNYFEPLKRNFLQNKLLRFFLIELSSLLASIFCILIISFAVVYLVGDFYIPIIAEPTAGVDDMGWGIAKGMNVMINAITSLMISLPIAVIIHVYLFKKFF